MSQKHTSAATLMDVRSRAYAESRKERRECLECGARLNYLNSSRYCSLHGALLEKPEESSERRDRAEGYVWLPGLMAAKNASTYTWERLAMRADVSHKSLQSWAALRWRAPEPVEVVLAELLGVDVEELKGGSG